MTASCGSTIETSNGAVAVTEPPSEFPKVIHLPDEYLADKPGVIGVVGPDAIRNMIWCPAGYTPHGDVTLGEFVKNGLLMWSIEGKNLRCIRNW